MLRLLTKTSFLSGVLIGIFLAVVLKLSINAKPEHEPQRLFSLSYKKLVKESNLIRQSVPYDILRYGNESYLIESDYLFDKINVLCIVLVKSTKNAQAIQDTWGRHCNKVTFVKISTDKKIQIRRSNRDSSWVVLCRLLTEVPEEFKWVLITYDYTFVLVENLRLFVAALNPDRAFYLGHTVKRWNTVYNLGQAGYVLSRGTVNVFKRKFSENDTCTKIITYRNQEDYYLGQNLAALNVSPVDTRDGNGLSTFHPNNLYYIYFPDDKKNKLSVFPYQCCSTYSITFQAIEGDKMYTYYYLLYTVQLFQSGVIGNRPFSDSQEDEEIWKSFLRKRNISENISSEQYYKIWYSIVDDPVNFAKHMNKDEF